MSAPAATLGPSAYWYLTRATGVVALVLLTVSVVLGVLGPLRVAARPRWPRFAIDQIHRDCSLLVLAVIAVHIVTTVLDGFAPITLLDGVIPFVSSYRPLWLGLGTFAFDLLVAVGVTSVIRRRLGYRAWRAVHWLAYASWPLAVLHGLGTGTDTRAFWSLLLTAACVIAVLIAVWARLDRARPVHGGLREAALAVTFATPLGLLIFTVVGPLQRGWARRAGTPTRLLASATPTRSAPSGAGGGASGAQRSGAAAAQPKALVRPFSAQLAGTIAETPEVGGAIIDLDMHLSGGIRGTLRVRLGGVPIGDGGLSMTGSQVDLLAAGLPSVLQGQITSLQGQQFVAHVRGADGTAFDLQASLNIDSQTNTVTGSLQGTPSGGG